MKRISAIRKRLDSSNDQELFAHAREDMGYLLWRLDQAYHLLSDNPVTVKKQDQWVEDADAWVEHIPLCIQVSHHVRPGNPGTNHEIFYRNKTQS